VYLVTTNSVISTRPEVLGGDEGKWKGKLRPWRALIAPTGVNHHRHGHRARRREYHHHAHADLELVHTCHLPHTHTHSLHARTYSVRRQKAYVLICAAGPLPPNGGPEQAGISASASVQTTQVADGRWMAAQCHRHRAFLPCCLPSKPTITWNMQDKFHFFMDLSS
jgi:hypothetical protein